MPSVLNKASEPRFSDSVVASTSQVFTLAM